MKKVMTMRRIISIFIVISLLYGCSPNEKVQMYAPHPTNDEKEIVDLLAKKEELSEATAIFYDHTVVVGVQVDAMKKWKKKKIENNLQKELESKYAQHEVFVSADLKIKWELDKVLKDSNINQQQKLKKSLSRIRKLAKEET